MSFDREKYFEQMVANGCSILKISEVAARLAGGYNSAPQKPLGANFSIFSEHGGLVDTLQGTCLAKDFEEILDRRAEFNVLGLNEAPEEVAAPATSVSIDPDIVSTTTPTISPTFIPSTPKKK